MDKLWDLIGVTPISINLYNEDPDFYLKDDVPPGVTSVTKNKINQVTIDAKDYGKNSNFTLPQIPKTREH